MQMQSAARRAAGIALVSSLYIVYLCLHYVAATAWEVAEVAAQQAGPFAARDVATTGASLLLMLVPLFLVLPFAGWATALRTTGGDTAPVGVARTATLIAVAVWILSIAFLKFGLPACAAAAAAAAHHPVSDESGYSSVRCLKVTGHPLEN